MKAVARKDGRVVAEQVIRTAGQPDHIELRTDYQGRELTFVEATVVDKDGNRCPWADNQVVFSTDGTAQVIATDNGCQTSMERFTAPERHAFFGRCIAVVKGTGTLTARSIGLQKGRLNIKQ